MIIHLEISYFIVLTEKMCFFKEKTKELWLKFNRITKIKVEKVL